MGRDPKTGKKRQKWYTITGTKRNAEREKTRLVHELNTGQYCEPSKLTVGDYLRLWLKDSAARKVSPKTFERYTEIVSNNLIPRIGSISLEQLRPLHVEAAYNELLRNGRLDGNGGLSAQTVIHCHRVLHKALRQAVKWQMAPRNVCEAVEPPTPEKHEMRALDEAQIVWLLEGTRGTRFYMPCLFAACTGVRRGELLACRWEDFSFATAVAMIRRSLEQTNEGLRFKLPKGKKGRPVTLPAFLVDVLREHKAEQERTAKMMGPGFNKENLVCCRPDGLIWKPDTFSTDFSKLARKLNLEIRFHDLRHSHASQMLKQGAPIKVVSERLGHSTPNITLTTYAHVLPGMQEEATKNFDRALRKAMESQHLPVS